MSPKLCETCKYKASVPAELLELYEEMRKYYPRVYYCSRLNAVKVYNPDAPSQMFECDLYEGG